MSAYGQERTVTRIDYSLLGHQADMFCVHYLRCDFNDALEALAQLEQEGTLETLPR